MEHNLEHFPAPEELVHEEITPTHDPVEQVDQQQPQQEPAETPSARNFRQLREKAERAERERDEAMRYIQSLQAKPKPEEDDLDLADDDLVERKHVDRIVEKRIKKYEDQLHQYELLRQEQEVLTQCKDYHQVVNDESVALLMQEYPEIAASLGSNQNLKSKAIATYNIIKKLGVNNMSAPVERPYSQEIERIQNNAKKPKPLASVSPQQGDSPLSRANAFANGLTDDLKAQLLKEMKDSRRGY